jgi:hypothetical protein
MLDRPAPRAARRSRLTKIAIGGYNISTPFADAIRVMADAAKNHWAVDTEPR